MALFLFFAFGYETGMGQLGGNVHLFWTAPGVGAHIQGEQISQSDISGSLNNSGLYQFFHQVPTNITYNFKRELTCTKYIGFIGEVSNHRYTKGAVMLQEKTK